MSVSVAGVPRITTDGRGMLERNVWAVVGNHGKNPVVDQLTARLTARGKTVYRVNPYGKPPAEYKSLGEIPDARSVECIDLVVNPTVGMDVVDDCQALGIWNLFIQPGAGSKELIDKARGKDMSVHEGCILLELPAPSL